MATPIEIGRIKGKLRKQYLIDNHERELIARHGNKADILQLKTQDEKFFRLAQHKEVKRMKIQVKNLSNPVFVGALQRLDRCGSYPDSATAWAVMKLIRNVNDAIKENREFTIKLAKEYAELDETGNVKLTEHQEIIYKDPAQQADHQKRFDEFMNMEVEITGMPMKLGWLEKAQISPMELSMIEPLMDQDSLPA